MWWKPKASSRTGICHYGVRSPNRRRINFKQNPFCKLSQHNFIPESSIDASICTKKEKRKHFAQRSSLLFALCQLSLLCIGCAYSLTCILPLLSVWTTMTSWSTTNASWLHSVQNFFICFSTLFLESKSLTKLFFLLNLIIGWWLVCGQRG